LRAAVVAAVAVGLAVAAHVVACGRIPSTPVTAVGSALAARVCWGCAASQLSRRRLAGLVVAVQAGLHVAFAVTGPMPPHATAASAPVYGVPAAGPGGAMHARVDLLPGGSAMVAAHLLAALVLAWWLAAGERALWRMARLAVTVARRAVGRVRRRRAAPPRTAVRRRPWGPRRHRQVGRPVLLRHVVIRRGPPVLV
jgi:hypothetical protein